MVETMEHNPYSGLFSVYKVERDPQGREVIVMGVNATLSQAAAAGVPLAGMAVFYFFVGMGPRGMPWYMVAIPVAFALIGYFVSGWICRRLTMRVTVDPKAGKLLVSAAGEQVEVPVTEIERTEFDVFRSTVEGKISTSYRLEFVMKNGERVPASPAYSTGYSLAHQAKAIAAINAAVDAALKGRMV